MKYEGMKVGKTLRVYCDKHSDKIAEVYRGGGYCSGASNDDRVKYDILLERGWYTFEKGLHTIIEGTVSDTIRELREIQPCNCQDCLAATKSPDQGQG